MNADRLNPRLFKKLQNVAVSFGRDPMDADDILGEMLEAIARLSSDEDSNSRLLTRARWVALSHVKALKIYARHVAPQYEAEVNFVDDEEQVGESDFVSPMTPEDAFVGLEMAAAVDCAISMLDTTDQRIVRLLRDGFQAADIARKLEVSRSAISQRMTRIARHFEASGFTPASL